MARQLLRAITSVGANIAEGYGRHKGKEYIRYLEIAYGSANEAENWLSVLRDANLMKEPAASELMSENAEVIKMLATMIRTLEKKIVRENYKKEEE